MSKQFLASSFRHKHHVVLAIPPRVGQALIILVHRVLLWFRLIKHPEENLLPERSKLFKSHWSNQWLTLWDLQLRRHDQVSLQASLSRQMIRLAWNPADL